MLSAVNADIILPNNSATPYTVSDHAEIFLSTPIVS